MEKIKITNSLVLKQVNMQRLKTSKLITTYFPIHDPY